MKTAIPLLLALIAMLCFAFGQTVHTLSDDAACPLAPKFLENGDRVILLKGKIAGDMKPWLIIEAHNGLYWKRDGYDPSYTHVLSDYQPMFRKLPTGQWEIMFTSEIAKDLP